MVERADRAPVATFHVPGPWSDRIELGEAAAHHVHVKRLQDGDPVRLTDGAGRRAHGVLARLGKRGAAVLLDPASVEHVAAPAAITLLAPVGDRDRMLLLAEKAVELGLTTWQPVVYARSRSVSPRGEGAAFREKVRARMVAALEQSGGAWLPAVHDERPLADALDVAGGQGLLLDGGGAPIASLCSSLAAPLRVALGPEGGLEPAERAALAEAGWRAVSLGGNVLRFETAGIAALAVLRAHLR